MARAQRIAAAWRKRNGSISSGEKAWQQHHGMARKQRAKKHQQRRRNKQASRNSEIENMAKLNNGESSIEKAKASAASIKK